MHKVPYSVESVFATRVLVAEIWLGFEQQLRQSITMLEKEEHDVRIEDYLDDKLQTGADLENIDTLLENVVKQQRLLQQQVCKVRINDQLSG